MGLRKLFLLPNYFKQHRIYIDYLSVDLCTYLCGHSFVFFLALDLAVVNENKHYLTPCGYQVSLIGILERGFTKYIQKDLNELSTLSILYLSLLMNLNGLNRKLSKI